ncbi:hypothetical protein ACLBOM_31110 [Escherichia coli]
MRAQFNPFDLYLGTSAGAQNLSAYLQSARLRAQSHHALYHKTRIFRSIALCPWRKSYRSRLAGESHRKSDAVANGYRRAVVLTAANHSFICAPVVRMTTRRLLTNQTKLAGCDSRLQCDTWLLS